MVCGVTIVTLGARRTVRANASGIALLPLRALRAGRTLGTFFTLEPARARVSLRPDITRLALLSLGSLISGVPLIPLRPDLALGSPLSLRARQPLRTLDKPTSSFSGPPGICHRVETPLGGDHPCGTDRGVIGQSVIGVYGTGQL